MIPGNMKKAVLCALKGIYIPSRSILGRDDLINAGLYKLLLCEDRYNIDNLNISITIAKRAMFDEIRRWHPRRVHRCDEVQHGDLTDMEDLASTGISDISLAYNNAIDHMTTGEQDALRMAIDGSYPDYRTPQGAAYSTRLSGAKRKIKEEIY